MPSAAAEVSPRQFVVVLGSQLVGVLLLIGVGLWATGGVGLVGPFGAMFLGAFGAFWRLGARQEGWPQRAAIWRVAWASACWFWGLGLLAYVALFGFAPEQFSFSAGMLVLLAPLVALLPALAALGLTLCAGDAAATALGSYDEVRLRRRADALQEDADGNLIDEEGVPVDMYERFSARTLSRRPPGRTR